MYWSEEKLQDVTGLWCSLLLCSVIHTDLSEIGVSLIVLPLFQESPGLTGY